MFAATRAGVMTRKEKAYRYWRVFILNNNGNGLYIALAEIELRKTIGGADETTVSTPVTASSAEAGNPVTNVRDNTAATFWLSSSGANTNQWVRLDLGAPAVIKQVGLQPQSGQLNRAPRQFELQGSNDGTTFSTVKAFDATGGWSGSLRTFDL